ncbi:MAG: metallophosphoesterase [Deltaproteobacteria bacterium]|nr:metallophosphoesterase [Deltaproteobacteria bacterium]
MGVLLYNLTLAVIGAATVYVQRHRLPLRGLFGYLMAVVGLASVFAYLFYRRPTEPLDPMFAAMRMMAYGLFLHLPVLLGAWGWLDREKRPRQAVAMAAVAVAIVAVAIDAFFIEPTALEVNEVTVAVPGLEAPLTVAVLADIQTERPGAYERGAMELALAAKPDLIVMPGDYVHAFTEAEYAEGMVAFRELVKQVGLRAPLGVYAVAGNVDIVGKWVEMFEGTGVETATVTRTFHPRPDVAITALTLVDSFDTQLKVPAQDGLHIVVGHGPDFALGEVHADLLVAGHTHGGQVRLPFYGPLLTLSALPRDWASGVTRLGQGRTLVVSRGVGLERGLAPRLRFRCRPEVVIVRVVPASAPAR